MQMTSHTADGVLTIQLSFSSVIPLILRPAAQQWLVQQKRVLNRPDNDIKAELRAMLDNGDKLPQKRSIDTNLNVKEIVDYLSHPASTSQPALASHPVSSRIPRGAAQGYVGSSGQPRVPAWAQQQYQPPSSSVTTQQSSGYSQDPYGQTPWLRHNSPASRGSPSGHSPASRPSGSPASYHPQSPHF